MNAKTDSEAFSTNRPHIIAIVVYGHRGSSSKEDIASVYRCWDAAQMASLLTTVATVQFMDQQITQIIFVDKAYEAMLAKWDVSIEKSVERGYINLPVESVDEYCCSYRLV